MRFLTAIIATLALTLVTTGAADAFGITAQVNTSTCGQAAVAVQGLSPNTAYQIVSVNSNVQITRNVTATGAGTATATYLRSEFPADSSYAWGQIQVRTQYGGYLPINGGTILSYHFC